MVNAIGDDGIERLWGAGVVRVFISHVATHKVLAKEISGYLTQYGISGFVAHEDIEPMRGWESEIERALFSMDFLVALLTDGFSESKWTDQEVGVAIGRGVPVVPVRLGKDPYGFIGKLQAMQGSNAYQIAYDIFDHLFRDGQLKGLSTNALIAALDNSGNFSTSNSLASHLNDIEELSPAQELALVKVFNGNGQVSHANAILKDIREHLKRMTGNDYEIDYNRLFLLS